jgi:hypothetical protein
MPKIRRKKTWGANHRVRPVLLAVLAVLCGTNLRPAHGQTSPPALSLTDAEAQLPSSDANTQQPSKPVPSGQQSATQQPSALTPAPAAASPAQQTNLPDAPKPAQSSDDTPRKVYDCTARPCQLPVINWYLRFENGPQVKPLTPREKGWLATKNVIDPFNIITILGEGGISVAADSHSAYGPGIPGWGRYVGVSFTQDITGEFFGTFLIPTIAHQDPHYHRMPKAGYKRRIFHAIYQVAWTEGDNGKGMLNYADLLGFGIDDEIGNLYIPGRETNARASADRYAIGLATAPIGNFITEFLPDVAKHIHVQVVIVQRIIDQVANKASSGT